ncbi:MAG: class I SAM-dependent methyltransferase [Holophagales bacterium]|jgi:16S rRNA (guanine(527)-N(7))-methyltransferase RsmG|nr:class I SAM-dependent methyltransferase [Holophagales bacterium]
MFTPIFPSKIQDTAEIYLRLLDKWNSVHSITALSATMRFEALLLDSAALIPHLEHLAAGSIVADFGSGMGIPAFVIAAYRPDICVLAIDRSHKKMAFTRQTALETGLNNLRAVCGSIESMPPLNAHFGTAKAVGSLDLLLSWWKRHSARGAPFFAFKGPAWNHSEINGEWDYETYPYTLPNLGERVIVKLKLF